MIGISDFRLVWEKAGVLSGRWDSIGILLGISYNKLYEIESETKTARGCLQKVFDCWLKRDYDYKSHGVPTLRMLCNSIKSNSGGADPALANEIAKEYTINLTSSGEATTSPVDTSSSKGKYNTIINNHFYLLFQKLLQLLSYQFLLHLNLSLQSFTLRKNHSKSHQKNKMTQMIGELQEVYLDNMYHSEKSFHLIDVSEVIDFVQHYIALLLSPRFQKPQMIDSI